MRLSLRGHQLPESAEEFFSLEEKNIALKVRCASCNSRFSGENTRTPLGWAETQISGLCENCFDAVFTDDEGDDGGAHD